MLIEPTVEKLRELRMNAMADAWRAQREDRDSHELDFDTRFGLLVDAEHLARDNKRVATALKEARLRMPNACIEDLDFSSKRDLDRGLIRQLATCSWIKSYANTTATRTTGAASPSSVGEAIASRSCIGIGADSCSSTSALSTFRKSAGIGGGYWVGIHPGYPPHLSFSTAAANSSASARSSDAVLGRPKLPVD